jgi:hypothetical protein
MPAESHTIMDGKVHVYRRENSRRWQCAVYLSGKNHRATTGHSNLAFAVAFAEDWYIERCADDRLLKRGVALPTAEQRVWTHLHRQVRRIEIRRSRTPQALRRPR